MLDNLLSMKKLAAAYISAIFTRRNTFSHRLSEGKMSYLPVALLHYRDFFNYFLKIWLHRDLLNCYNLSRFFVYCFKHATIRPKNKTFFLKNKANCSWFPLCTKSHRSHMFMQKCEHFSGCKKISSTKTSGKTEECFVKTVEIFVKI